MNSILQQIVQHKLEEIIQAKTQRPLHSLIMPKAQTRRDFIAALKPGSEPAIIAEIKKASPSKGVIKENFDVIQIASIYEQFGARCLSVLTDIPFFQGHPDYLTLAKSHCNLPVLRKDFIIDPYQIYESAALGADCILLIVALLDPVQMADYCCLAQELNMAVLVESHTKEELDQALLLPTPLMGINNRSLHTFQTDIQRSIELSSYIHEDKIVISESGIHSPEHIQLLQAHGINTFLIGGSLMKADNIGLALRNLINVNTEADRIKSA